MQRSTARTHVQNLLTKLGVHSRLQAAALMSAHGSTVAEHLRWRTSADGILRRSRRSELAI